MLPLDLSDEQKYIKHYARLKPMKVAKSIAQSGDLQIGQKILISLVLTIPFVVSFSGHVTIRDLKKKKKKSTSYASKSQVLEKPGEIKNYKIPIAPDYRLILCQSREYAIQQLPILKS